MPSVEVEVQVGGAGGWRPKQQQKHRHHHHPLEIRQVWADNVDREFKLIRAAIERFPYVSMDTEFPGVIHHPPPAVHHSTLTAPQRYALLKSNVDALHLIQVGLALAPSPGSPPALAFQINLRGFDPRVHRHAPDSVRLLASSGLICNPAVAWVTFSSAYDFAYLVKLLMGRKLPRALPDFLRYVRVYFGAAVYDVKHMARVACASHGEVALLGGLERVAAALRVRRAAGQGHQAASDSVLTWDTFREMARIYFPKEGSLEPCAGVLYGLELPN
uniref:poly(A)-specific ribonuclease n=1 Tax=Zea mays TaxID=4577 RepID=B4FG62_MAIZE|nr:unknown [Zea mays]|eukprot:NP_001132309.2 uncharacterized LOC100193751 [Zea mays]